MKKIISLLSLLSTVALYAQQHPGEYVELLRGKNVTIDANNDYALKYGYIDFSFDELGVKDYDSYSDLAGKTFKVTDIKPTKYSETIYTLKLEGDGKTLYYKYNSKIDSPYFFDVEGGIELPAEYYAAKVTKKVSDDGLITYTSERTGGMRVIKTIHPEVGTSYAFSCFVFSNELYKDDLWAFFALDNEEVILKKDASIEVGAVSAQFRYSVLFLLTDAELELLKDRAIVMYGVNTSTEKSPGGEALRGLLNYMETLN